MSKSSKCVVRWGVIVNTWNTQRSGWAELIATNILLSYIVIVKETQAVIALKCQGCLSVVCPSCRWRLPGAVAIRAWPPLRQFSILYCSQQGCEQGLQVFRAVLWSWLSCFVLLTRTFQELSIDIKTNRLFLPADGRTASHSAAVLALQRNGGVKISGKITIVGNSGWNSWSDSEQTTDCQAAVSILAPVF